MDVGISAHQIGDYRILWLRLRYVVLKTGRRHFRKLKAVLVYEFHITKSKLLCYIP